VQTTLILDSHVITSSWEQAISCRPWKHCEIWKEMLALIKIFIPQTMLNPRPHSHLEFSLVSIIFFFFLVVLGFELRAYTLSHSTSPFLCERFFRDRVL
jgi:hypothetical protein